MRFLLALLATHALAAIPGAAQDAADSSAPARKLTITGYAEASYSYTTRNVGNQIVGRLYDRFHDEVALNTLALTFEVPHDPTSMSAGFHAEVLFGQNASVIKSGGFSLGDQGDIPHLYATLNIPTADGNGLQLKLGRIPTLLGLEVIEDIANPNWSEGNQFIYVENFTGTGLSVEHKFSDRVDAQFRVFNGWDLVEDNNTRKSFMGRLGLTPREGTSIALLGFFGPEQADNPEADRYGGEILFGTKPWAGTTLWVQGDYGVEQANGALPDPTQDAKWWGVGVWLTHDLSPAVALALRGDYVDDRDGARTSGFFGFPANTGHRFGSATATLNVRSWQGMLLRPELRYDRSNLEAFDGEQDQFSFALSAAYIF
jgi:hypothetical protein